MKIGGYDLYSIETSRFGLDGGAMFGIIPKPLWEKEAPADDKNRIHMVTRSLLLVVTIEKSLLIRVMVINGRINSRRCMILIRSL